MAQKKDNKKVTLLGYDPIETPQEIISSDKNDERKESFKQAYKKVMQIIPDYFISQRKKRKASGGAGGKSFTQSIIVTPENVKVETNEIEKVNEERKGIEREE